MITEAVCADKPVRRAISALGNGPSRRRIDNTSRSLRSRTPDWFVPSKSNFEAWSVILHHLASELCGLSL